MKLNYMRCFFLIFFALVGFSLVAGFVRADDSPNVTILSPNQSFYGYNQNIPLNIDVVDDIGVSSCWYTLDNGGTNVSLPSCLNTTLDVSEGSTSLIVYANDTINNFGSDSVDFTTSLSPPVISISNSNPYYSNTTGVSFTYTPTDQDLQACNLWGNFSGPFALQQTNSSLVSGIASVFQSTLNEGVYLWAVYCNDSNGHETFSSNRSVIVDTTAPSLTISKPSGTYNSSSIPLAYSVSDNFGPIECSYYVNKSTGASAVSPTSFSSCSNTTFSISTNGDYVLYLTARDGAGNTDFDSKSFIVSISSNPNNPNNPSNPDNPSDPNPNTETAHLSMDIEVVSEISLRRGESEIVSVKVTNTGDGSLDECSIVGEGLISSWFSSPFQSIDEGAEAEFPANITVPLDASEAQYVSHLIVNCEGYSDLNNFTVNLERSFNLRILEQSSSGRKILVNYSVEKFKEETLTLRYSVLDAQKNVVKEGEEDVEAGNGTTYSILEISAPPIEGGPFELVLQLESESDLMRINLPLSIESSEAGITGLALFGDLKLNKRNLGIGVLVIAPFIVLFFVSRWIKRYRISIALQDNERKR